MRSGSQKQRHGSTSRRKGHKSQGSGSPESRSLFTGPTTVNCGKNVVGFPDRFKIRLKYSETVSFSGSAAPSAVVFAVNSLFDPNFSGSGHQPSYYDALTAVYGRYLVTGVEATVSITNQTSGMSINAVVVLSDQNNSTQTVEQLSESKFAKTRMIGQSGAVNVGKINIPHVKMSKIMGSKYLEGDDNMYAVVSATPADIAFMSVKLAATDLTTTIVGYARVTIVFDAVFKDLVSTYPSLIKSLPTPRQEVEDEDTSRVDCRETGEKIGADKLDTLALRLAKIEKVTSLLSKYH